MKYNPFDGRIYKAQVPPGSIPFEQEVGYLSVSVFTASGALPVEGALVTVYIRDESGAEHEIVHHIPQGAMRPFPKHHARSLAAGYG